jgi:hypothetical protein
MSMSHVPEPWFRTLLASSVPGLLVGGVGVGQCDYLGPARADVSRLGLAGLTQWRVG